MWKHYAEQKIAAMRNRLIIGVCIIALLVYLLIDARIPGDFSIYVQASADLFHKKDIYTQLYNQWYHYYYSVLFAIILYPFTKLPLYVSQFLWLALNAWFVYRVVKIIAWWLDADSLKPRTKELLLLLCFVFGFRFLRDNFHLKQMTIALLYLSLEGMYFVNSGKKATGGLLIAIVINIKLLPIVLLPYLLYRREIKVFSYTLLFYAGMMFLPSLIIGFQRNNELLSSWLSLINPMAAHNILDVDERSFHGLSTLLSTLLVKNVPDYYSLHIRRNIADISITQLSYILNITRLALIAFSFWFFRTKPFVAAPGKLHGFRELSYLLLLIPLIFPHQQQYAFLFIMPAVSFIFYFMITGYRHIPPLKFKWMIGGCIVSYLACNLALLLGEFNDYYDHFKILTYGALLIIPILAVTEVRTKSEVL